MIMMRQVVSRVVTGKAGDCAAVYRWYLVVWALVGGDGGVHPRWRDPISQYAWVNGTSDEAARFLR